MVDERPSWPAFTIACVLCGLVVGVGVGVMLMLRRRDVAPANRQLASAQLPALKGWPTLPGVTSKPVPELDLDFMGTLANKTKLATIIVSDTETSQVMMASGGRAWRVQVSTIGPAGAFAVFGHDSNMLIDNINASGVLAVPAGAHRDLELSPGQYLYARGSVANTMVSISARMLDA